VLDTPSLSSPLSLKPLAALLVALIGFAVMFRLLSLKATLVLILLAGALPICGPPLLRATPELPVRGLAVRERGFRSRFCECSRARSSEKTRPMAWAGSWPPDW